MKRSVKQISVILMVSLMTIVLLLQVSNVSAVESAQETTLNVLRDVVKIDISKYNVELISDVTKCRDDLGGLYQEQVAYTLKNNDSELSVVSTFIDTKLASTYLYVIRGSPVYIDKPSGGLVDQTKSLLQRLPNYSTTKHLQQFNTMLNSVNKLENITIVSENAKLIISVGDFTTFRLLYSAGGIDYTNKGVVFTFDRNGVLYSFGDAWDLYKVGSETVEVSEEAAIGIALGAVPKDYSYEMTYWNGTTATITGINVVESTIQTELSLRSTREPLTLYPMWVVHLYFDQIYPGNFYGWTVYIWGDTGEVIAVESKLFMGDPPGGSSQSSTTTSETTTSKKESDASQIVSTTLPEEPTQQQLPTTPDQIPDNTKQTPTADKSPIDPYLIAITFAILIPIAITAIALKKKSK
jgi:hypothetical protein